MSQVPTGYLQWMKQDGVLDAQKGAQAVLDEELRKREQSPHEGPTQELVSAMGFVIYGPNEGTDISKMSPSELKRLLKTRGITAKSKARIMNILTKRQRARRRKKRRGKK